MTHTDALGNDKLKCLEVFFLRFDVSKAKSISMDVAKAKLRGGSTVVRHYRQIQKSVHI